MDAEQRSITAPDGTPIAVTRHHGGDRAVVFLHAGVADRRAWDSVAAELADDGLDLVAYDRRGYGDTPAAADPASFTHVDDLLVVLDDLGVQQALLVGNSMGGGLALDTALLHPERVSGAVLIGAGASGMTDEDTPFDWVLDAATEPLLEVAEDDGAPTEDRIAALAHLWLDGPTAPEGRVSGPARELFVAMNQRILDVAAADSAGAAGVGAWTRLGEVTVPVLTTWGDLDIPADLPFYEETARRLGQGPGRVLPGVAHLPGLERPALVADLVRGALSGR
ncbi:alpha/beta fold hydrolase [Curtobacterium sp. VKM Ac-2922]|uniref:alpha/beta fold hydrolase n=1 Tax=Curtobacterium sp. VKM Ac-2922 TaxID=2929475 RepID=UPI001FB50ACD|nr:alpha/beta hydrolase [Curtobacterium sp. VKM Ac-2922]MCJ1714345.1 alpha/beta hydrolase [Curtobacterium sp. VKM Ac-2922]